MLAALTRSQPTAAAALGVKPTAGGRQLYDPGTGAEYATDAQGFYVDSNGDRLTVDAQWAAGDEVGHTASNGNGVLRLYSPYGVDVGVVIGAPATGRRSGFTGFTTSAYASVTLSSSGGTALAAVERDGSNITTVQGLLFGAGTDPRWGLAVSGTNVAGAWDGSSILASTGSVLAPSTSFTVAATQDPTGPAAVYVYSSTGTLVDSDTGTQAPVAGSMAGVYYLGRTKGGGPFVNGDIPYAAGWDGTVLSGAQVATSEAALRTYGVDAAVGVIIAAGITPPQLLTDGIINGAIDLSDTTALPYIGAEGDGTPVVVSA